MKLPSVPDSISAETLYTTHRKPQLHNYDEILGRVDQEIVQSKNTAIVEFYRFEKGSAYLVGYTNPDSTKPFTIIDPPLLIMPGNINELKEAITSAGTSKDWNRDSLVEGYRTTFTISKKESGSFITPTSFSS